MKWKVKKIIDLQGITVKAGYFVICPSCELKQMFISQDEKCNCYKCGKSMSLDELLRITEQGWLDKKISYTEKMRRQLMNKYKLVEKYLRKYKWIKSFLDNANELLKELEEDYQGAKTFKLELVTCYNNDFFSVVEAEAMEREEKIDYLNFKIKEAKHATTMIEEALENLCDIDKKIIELYYIENQPWFKIAYQVSLSEKQCRKRRTETIKEMIFHFFGPKLGAF